MSEFQKKYEVQSKLIPVKSKRRSGHLINEVKFIVAHDTGNLGSTALNNVNYYIRTCNGDPTVKKWMPASAHIFIDDTSIIECIPSFFGTPEKAWHVLYNLNSDNQLFGADANDAAIGVEFCYGPKINSDEAYKRYIWLIAYLCFKYQLDPGKAITGHFILDPQRKTDPVTGLAFSRRTYEQLLKDIVLEYKLCTDPQFSIAFPESPKALTAISTARLNIRKDATDTKSPIVRVVNPGEKISIVAEISNGQSINNNPIWYKDTDGHYLWSGGVKIV